MQSSTRSFAHGLLGISLLSIVSLISCAPESSDAAGSGGASSHDMTRAPGIPAKAEPGVAIFAGGCFWCMESAFDKLEGVTSATSGFTAGNTQNPSYAEVSSGGTGHTEAIRVVYDPSRLTYDKLLEVFWHNIDPTQADGQFCDRGTQYRSGIYPLDAEQKQKAEASKKALEEGKKLPGPIVTEIVSAGTFYPAEAYHQDFWKKEPMHYQSYRLGCGRDRRLEQLWGSSGH